jgi:hypothetical protein
MTGKDFILFAQTLHGHKDEAARRSSVSRAYYGLFHQVKSVVASAGIRVPNDASAHPILARYLKETGKNGVAGVRNIGEKLEELRAIRNDADYNLEDRGFSKETCFLQFVIASSSYNKLLEIDSTELKRV